MNNHNSTALTEQQAAYVFAKARNPLKPDALIDALDDDIKYTSQAVLTPMISKKEVADYLVGKMNNLIDAEDAKVFTQLAETQP